MAARGVLPFPSSASSALSKWEEEEEEEVSGSLPCPAPSWFLLSPSGTQCPGRHPVPRQEAPGLLKMGTHIKGSPRGQPTLSPRRKEVLSLGPTLWFRVQIPTLPVTSVCKEHIADL